MARATPPIDPELEPDDELGDDDAEALSWAGDSDRGQAHPTLARAVNVELRDAAADDEPVAPRGSAATTLVTGLFGALYLAFTIGWIFAVQTLSSPSTQLLPEVMWQFGEFLAMIGAALWFGATVSLTRGRALRVRLGWFALGSLVLLPWPVVVGWLS